MGAALAFMAAHRQGKAWAMHDKMFANNTALTRPDLDKYAQEIGLDMAKFAKDMDDPKLKEQVEADQKQGTSLGASGTPTFFINGRQLVGAQPFEKFKEVIDDEIKKADELIKAGTPVADVYKKRTESP
jgi:protein-disulfide isomerase